MIISVWPLITTFLTLVVIVLIKEINYSLPFFEYVFTKYIMLKIIPCLIADRINVILTVIFILIGSSGIYTVISAIELPFSLLKTCLALFIFIIVLLIYGLIKYYCYIKSLEYANLYPKSHRFQNNIRHIAIVWPIYTRFTRNLIISDQIRLLIDNFRRKGKAYKIYRICNQNDFFNKLSHVSISEIWILGHGNRGQFSFGKENEEDCISYSNLDLEQFKIDKVYQLHCGAGAMPSLKSVLQTEGFIIETWVTSFENRYNILKIQR